MDLRNKRKRNKGKFAEEEKVEVVCYTCGKRLLRTKTSVKGKKRFYCNLECQRNRGSIQKVQKKCKNCGRLFITYKSRDQIFCSKDCYTAYGRKLYTCAYCGKQRVDKKCLKPVNGSLGENEY